MILPSLRLQDTKKSPDDLRKERAQLLSSVFDGQHFEALFSVDTLPAEVGEKNCENWVGSVEIPVGVAGPIRFDFEGKVREAYVPMATTEGALVASVSRGCKVLSEATCSVLVKKIGMTRAPVFTCQSEEQVKEVISFLELNWEKLVEVAASTSNHLTLLSFTTYTKQNNLFVRFVFDTGEAMGMNMTTIAAQALSDFITSQNKGVELIALSSNVCTDKKDSTINSELGRGYWVEVEVTLPVKVTEEVLKTSVKKLLKVFQAKIIDGSEIAGSHARNAQVANVVSAIYIATGQDPAHVVEGSQSFLEMKEADGGLYVKLLMPSVQVGSVGGGTYLPAQKEAQQLLNPKGEVKAKDIAVVVGVASLAGELSLLASLAEHTLACSHQKLGRSNK